VARDTKEDGPSDRRWCLAVGLPGLAFWLLTGLGLEALHAVKAAPYLQDELRREMWTLAHAHGTLLSAVAIVIALTFSRLSIEPRAARRVDRLYAVGAAALPWGFFLGGLSHSETDPGLGIFLVPASGLLAAAGLGLLTWSWWRSGHE